MKRVLAALLVSLSLSASAPAKPAADPAASAAAADQVRPKRAALRFTRHAQARIQERGVSRERVEQAIEKGESFRYFHQAKWKTGYYDAGQRLFIATDGNVVITVITDADREYIERLKSKGP